MSYRDTLVDTRVEEESTGYTIVQITFTKKQDKVWSTVTFSLLPPAVTSLEEQMTEDHEWLCIETDNGDTHWVQARHVLAIAILPADETPL